MLTAVLSTALLVAGISSATADEKKAPTKKTAKAKKKKSAGPKAGKHGWMSGHGDHFGHQAMGREDRGGRWQREMRRGGVEVLIRVDGGRPQWIEVPHEHMEFLAPRGNRGPGNERRTSRSEKRPAKMGSKNRRGNETKKRREKKRPKNRPKGPPRG